MRRLFQWALLLLVAANLSAAELPSLPPPDQINYDQLAADMVEWWEPRAESYWKTWAGVNPETGFRPTLYFLPRGVRTVRGVWIQHPLSRVDVREIAQVLQFAVVIPWGRPAKDMLPAAYGRSDYSLMLRDGAPFVRQYLQALGARTGHPELANVPIVFQCFQGGETKLVETFHQQAPWQPLAWFMGWHIPQEKVGALQVVPYYAQTEQGQVFVRGTNLMGGAASFNVHPVPGKNNIPHGVWGSVEFWAYVAAQQIRECLPSDQLGLAGPVQLRRVKEAEAWRAAPGNRWRPVRVGQRG